MTKKKNPSQLPFTVKDTEKPKEKKKYTRMALHSVDNITPGSFQRELFNPEAVPVFDSRYGHKADSKIESYGLSLNVMDFSIVEGILKAFTETDYKGNLPKVKAHDLAQRKYKKQMPEAYKVIGEFPCIRITERALLELSGISKGCGVHIKKRARESILKMGNQQYFFRYQRLAKDRSGKPIFEKEKDNGKKIHKKEIVEIVDTPFTIKQVKREGSEKLKYYEITPSVIFYDQIDSYFMLIPHQWREEIRLSLGKARVSHYLLNFILFLMRTHERYRSKKATPPFIVPYKWQTIAQYIKMPDSMWKRQIKRANETLQDCYETAEKLDYLSFFTRNAGIDTLGLNSAKFPTQKEITG